MLFPRFLIALEHSLQVDTRQSYLWMVHRSAERMIGKLVLPLRAIDPVPDLEGTPPGLRPVNLHHSFRDRPAQFSP